MTRLEELKAASEAADATYADAEAAYDAAWDAAREAAYATYADAFDAAREARGAARDAYKAYKAELKKQKETKND